MSCLRETISTILSRTYDADFLSAITAMIESLQSEAKCFVGHAQCAKNQTASDNESSGWEVVIGLSSSPVFPSVQRPFNNESAAVTYAHSQEGHPQLGSKHHPNTLWHRQR